MNAKSIILSWDFIVAIILAAISYCVLPKYISNKFAVQLYGLGVSVLSIVFSVYFASLAVIIASPSDDFVKFFNEKGGYNKLLNIYKYTLLMLFLGLAYSIVGFAVSSFFVEEFEGKLMQNKNFIFPFLFLFPYALFCSFNSAKDAIMYSVYRNEFLKDK